MDLSPNIHPEISICGVEKVNYDLLYLPCKTSLSGILLSLNFFYITYDVCILLCEK